MLARALSVSVAAILVLVSAEPLPAQPRRVGEPARVLVLGTYHFDSPGLDVVKTEVADVLAPARQAEIIAVIEALARFRPDKIAIERLPASVAKLDSMYEAYLSGQHELSRSETQQLGFRLAARLGHQRLHPIDHREDFPFEAMMEYAQLHDTAFVAFVNEARARAVQ